MKKIIERIKNQNNRRIRNKITSFETNELLNYIAVVFSSSFSSSATATVGVYLYSTIVQ
tara:strand:- start:421 stop:597 length:177 start_codon:yes stop_codon:yes gene_type:complete